MHKKVPIVTVGIPTFNRAYKLRRAIDSVLDQDYENIELIVSDNASNDETKLICMEYAAADPRLQYFCQSSNVGIILNFREVLEKASGEFFMWLGDDDWIDSNYISAAVQIFQINPVMILVSGTPRYYRNGHKIKNGKVFKLIYNSWWRRVIAYYWQVTDNGMCSGLMRKAQIIRFYHTESWPGDWLIIARLASFGKITMLENTSIHRELGGVSRRYQVLAKTCGFSFIIGLFPFTAAAINAMVDIIRMDSSFKTFPSPQRLMVGISVFIVILTKAALTYAILFKNFTRRLLLRKMFSIKSKY